MGISIYHDEVVLAAMVEVVSSQILEGVFWVYIGTISLTSPIEAIMEKNLFLFQA